jgi:hypothetical protein
MLALVTSAYVGVLADAGLSDPRTENVALGQGVFAREVDLAKMMKRKWGVDQ